MKRILNWIIETFYPDRMFYGKRCNPFLIFENGTQKKNEPVMMGAMFLANHVADMGATDAEFVISGVSKSGEKRGDWIITVSQKEGSQ